MSVRVMADVWDSALKGSTAVHVMAVLANSADDNGMNCFPGTRLIARRARVSERTVARTIQELESGAWLWVIQRGSGAGHRSEYRLNVHRLHEQAELTRAAEREQMLAQKGCHAVTLVHKPGRVTLAPEKGDIDARKGDIDARKGDIGATKVGLNDRRQTDLQFLSVRDPSRDPSEDPTHTGAALPRESVCVLETRAALGRATDQVCSALDIENRRTRQMVLRSIAKRAEKGDEPHAIALGMIAAVRRKGSLGELVRPCGLERFLGDGMWSDEGRWPWDRDAQREIQLREQARQH